MRTKSLGAGLSALLAIGLAATSLTPANAAILPAATSESGPYTNQSVQVETATAPGARGAVALLPDTQFYSRYAAANEQLFTQQYGDIADPFASQTQWIVDNTDAYNIEMTQHLGDVVDRDDARQWAVAKPAMSILADAGAPFAMIPGNHDVIRGYWVAWPGGADGVWDSYLAQFPVEGFQDVSPSFREASANKASSMHKFTVAGVEMMSVNIADQRDFGWADSVLAANPKTPAIVTMHEILDISGDGTAKTFDPGEQAWDKVISKHPNVFLTLNGHNHGVTNQVRYINDDPNLPVFQQLVDYQMAFQGGNGQMSLMEFDFTHNQLSLTGFSPWVLEKPADKLTELDFALLTGDGETFTIPFDFKTRFAAFGDDVKPTGSVPSATIKLREHLEANFEAPEAIDLREPTGAEDYPVVEKTVAHWRPQLVDGKLAYADITGNGNTMTLGNGTGHVKLVDDHYAYSSAPKAVEFTPVDGGEFNFFKTAADAPINTNQFKDGYTIEMFVKMTPEVSNRWMAAMFRDADGMLDGDGAINFGISNLNEARFKSAGWADVEGWSNWSGEIFKGNWYHLTAINDVEKGSVELFINGNPILRNRYGELHNGIHTGTAGSAVWLLGAAAKGSPFFGTIGEARITEGALPRDQWLTARAAVERKPVTATAAAIAPVGRTANVWGTVDGAATVRTQVKLPNGAWSTSQVREANGGYVIPLTYGANTSSTYQWRVQVTYPDGTVETSAEFTQRRLARPTINTAGSAPVGRTANAWGTVDGQSATKVWTEVRLPNGSWSRSQVGVTKANGGYVLELTYGKNTAGTIQWRVGAEYAGIGTMWSDAVTFTRR